MFDPDSRRAALQQLEAAWPFSQKALQLALVLTGALIGFFLLRDPSFNDAQRYVLYLLLLAVGLWVTEAIPPFATGLLIMGYLAFFLGSPRFNAHPEDVSKYVETFASPVIWLMLGGFFIAEGLTRTGLDRELLRFTLHLSGPQPKRILLGLMLTSMAGSMIMSNTATTAMMIAAAMPLLRKLGKGAPFAKALLVGIPAAAAVGGMGTIIGSPPNAIAVGALENAGLEIGFLDWMLYGFPVAVLLTLGFWFLLVSRWVPKVSSIQLELPEDAVVHPERKRRRRITIFTLIATLGLWLTSELHGLSASIAALLPIVTLTLAGVIEGQHVRAMAWDTLLLVAGGLSLGIAMNDTGLLDHYVGVLQNAELPPLILLPAFAVLTVVLSNIMSNTATSTLLIPVAMALLPQAPVAAAVAIGLCASTALMLPVSTPPNAIAYATGLVDQKDFRLGGTMIGLIGPVLILLWVLFLSR